MITDFKYYRHFYNKIMNTKLRYYKYLGTLYLNTKFKHFMILMANFNIFNYLIPKNPCFRYNSIF